MRGLRDALLAVKYFGQRLIVDPAGCKCIQCIMWDSISADELTDLQKDQVVDGYKVFDRTGYNEIQWEEFLV